MIYGIDVSKHNNVTSWEQIKASGKSFVFIRLGWANWNGTITKDEKFETHYQGAIKAGLEVGIYVYSYLKDESYARIAARNTIDMLKGRSITYPVAFDYEESKIASTLTKAKNTAICSAFLGEVQKLGYYAMMYTYTSFINEHLNIDGLKAYAMWIADYRDHTATNCPYKGDWGIWQYIGDKGSCNGVAGACDCNVSKYDYAKTIKEKGLNGYKKGEVNMDYAYVDYVDNSVQTSNQTVQADATSKYLVDYTREQASKIVTYNASTQGKLFLSPHFQVSEFKSPDSTMVKIDNRLIWILERLFKDLNCSKMIINSGYRTPSYSVKVGGTSNDRHVAGQAADIKCYNKSGKIISGKTVCCKLCDYGNVFGIGYISETAVHVDARERTAIWLGDESKNISLIKAGYTNFNEYFYGKTLVVNNGNWNIRSQPNTSGKVVTFVKGGTTYKYSVISNGWAYIPSLGGYISKSGYTIK